MLWAKMGCSHVADQMASTAQFQLCPLQRGAFGARAICIQSGEFCVQSAKICIQ
eukprot:gene7148-2906_t